MGVYGWRLLSLISAAVVGGYALATAMGVFLGSILSSSRGEAVLTGMHLGFVVYAGAIIWVFAVRKPGLAWLGLLMASAFLTVMGVGLRGHIL